MRLRRAALFRVTSETWLRRLSKISLIDQEVWNEMMHLPEVVSIRNCRMEGEPGADAADQDKTLTPYPARMQLMFGNWFIPIYNLFDLHNPVLLTAGKITKGQIACPDRSRPAPNYLFLLAPSDYVKPDTVDQISPFETEGRRGAGEDKQDSYLLLTQFVILACNTSDIAAVKDEWERMMDTAAGTPRKHGACGNFIHGVFSGKSFVELRNRFSIDGRIMEDGVLNLTTIGQASGDSLGARMNVESAPGARPLIELWRVPVRNQDNRTAQRLLIRFFTTNSDVLDYGSQVNQDRRRLSASADRAMRRARNKHIQQLCGCACPAARIRRPEGPYNGRSKRRPALQSGHTGFGRRRLPRASSWPGCRRC